MCPDSQILSVYFDGELPDPWRTRLESHLASCAACREKRARWERHRNAIRSGEDADMEAARNRVWENLSASHGRAHGRIKPARRAAPAFWRRSVAIPLPAAAAAAVAIVALAFALFRAQNGNAGARGIEPQMAAGMSLDAREVVPVSDMNGVFQYLGGADNPDFVIIHLPEDRVFSSAGRPAVIKAAEYSRSGSN